MSAKDRYELHDQKRPCASCGNTAFGCIGIDGQAYCWPCWESIERRPGRVIGREIRDGLKKLQESS